MNILPVVDRVEDLWIIIDSHLTFTHHMGLDQTVTRAFTRANLINKFVVLCDTDSNSCLYSMSDLSTSTRHVFGNLTVLAKLYK